MEKKKDDSRFFIEDLFRFVAKKARLSEKDSKLLEETVSDRIRKKPFRVAIIGQSGVGKTSTLNAVFGLNEYVSDVAEGTTKIEEHIFPIKDGFSLAIYDMPGLNNDIVKDMEYEEMYKSVLPQCDVIVYIINAHSKDIGEDCRILKDIIMPICKEKDVLKNMVIAVNKIDTIGQAEDPNDPELRWDIINNVPTEKLKKYIKIKLGAISEKLIEEKIAGLPKNEDAVSVDRIVFYSAVFNYNLRAFMMAILNTPEGVIWVGTVGLDRIGKWSDMVLK